MTNKECARQYLEWLQVDEIDGIDRIIDSLNSLVYIGSNVYLSRRHKLDIIDEMIEELPSQYPILEHSDNQSILQLIQIVRAAIESDKGDRS